ncbi:MAG: NAD(P)-binding domain-containing protein, partial [Pseudomonadota bacterium]|nr:NAD(P)-binding domain-containing protein [Pseudomonadota bacterium]
MEFTTAAHAAIKNDLIRRLDARSATIGILGLGYVGLPLSLRFAEVGYRVIGMDIDPQKVEQLTRGGSYILHIPPASVAAARSKRFEATADYSRAKECDALIICVPTPLNRFREPDLSFVIGTIESLTPHLRSGQIISLESTTYPGTTEEELRTRVESRGFAVGSEVFVCFSPEREDPGNSKFVTRNIPKICGGCTPDCLDVGIALYRQIVEKV